MRVVIILEQLIGERLNIPRLVEEVEAADLVLGMQKRWQPVLIHKNAVNAQVVTRGRGNRWPILRSGLKVLVITDWSARHQTDIAARDADIAAADLAIGVSASSEPVVEIKNTIAATVITVI